MIPRALAVLPAFLMALGFAAAPPARADAVRVKYFTRVAEGERPRVRFEAAEPIGRLTVELVREGEGGETFRESWSLLGPGDVRELALSGAPGRSRYSGRIVVEHAGAERENTLALEAVVAPKLALEVDKSRVDLAARRIEARLSRPAAEAEIKVFAPTGALLSSTTQSLGGRPAGELLVVTWPPASADVARIDLKITDVDGFFSSVSLVPWSVYIPHEEVTFATDKADIAPNERPKLDTSLSKIGAALTRHKELGRITLFIAGHTDTVGDPAYNLRLSQARARAIATYFRKKGLRIPIAFEGFGEHALIVATADNVDEARNRRVDYILAVEEPAMKTVGWRPVWKRVP